MKRPHLLSLLLGLSCALAGFSAVADDDDDDDDRRGRRHGHERKEKYRDGHCKVEREWKKDGSYEEERKCKGKGRSRPAVEQPMPASVVYPPWIVVEHGAPAYHPQHLPSGPAAGVLQCKSREVGQALGGVLGGILGSQVGKGSGRAVTTVGGAIAGVLLGGEIGRRIDANDQACMGQVLEFATVGRPVQWTGMGQNHYTVVPHQATRRGGMQHCRPFNLEVRGPQGSRQTQEIACRRNDGVWVAR